MTDPIGAGPTVGEVGEHALIARIREKVPVAPSWVTVGIGDDAAVVAPVRNELEVVTTDACVEGVHFDRAFVPPDAIGHRALAVNLSDLAAMGATPRFATLSLILPALLPASHVDALLDGMLALAAEHGVALVGGNIARSPGPLVVDVMAAGTVKHRRLLTRRGARPGDLVYVSGSLGAAHAGLGMCAAGTGGTQAEDGAADTESPDPRQRYLRPQPRVRLGSLLGRMQAATACMDLSDGLADGLQQVAAASGIGLAIDAGQLPIDQATRRWFESRGEDPIHAALSGGDDYELLFTVSPRRGGRLRAVTRLARGLGLTRIGTVTRERQLVLQRDGRREDLPQGFVHFRR